MRNFSLSICGVLSFILFIGCSQKDLFEEINNEESSVIGSFSNKTYEEEACGSIEDLCLKCLVVTDESILNFRELGDQPETTKGVDNNFIKVLINNIEYTIRPANFFEGGTNEYLISSPSGNYITSNIQNNYVESKALDLHFPKSLEAIHNLSHELFSKGEFDINQIGGLFGGNCEIQNLEGGGLKIIIESDARLSNPEMLRVYNPCEDVTMSALVLKYKEVLGMNEPHSNAEEIIENAITGCIPENFNPRADCVNTQCVVDNILDNEEIQNSTHAPSYIKLNYLYALLSFSEEEYSWLYDNGTSLNFDLIDLIYGELSNEDGLCDNVECSKIGGLSALIKLVASSDEFVDIEGIVEFSSLLYCSSEALYDRFESKLEELFFAVGNNCSEEVEFYNCLEEEYTSFYLDQNGARRKMCSSSILPEMLTDPNVEAWYFQLLDFSYIFHYRDPTNPSFTRIFNVGFGRRFCIQVLDGIVTSEATAKISFVNAFELAIDQTLDFLNTQPWDDILFEADPFGTGVNYLVDRYISTVFSGYFIENLAFIFGGTPSLSSDGCPGVQGFVPNFRVVSSPADHC